MNNDNKKARQTWRKGIFPVLFITLGVFFMIFCGINELILVPSEYFEGRTLGIIVSFVVGVLGILLFRSGRMKWKRFKRSNITPEKERVSSPAPVINNAGKPIDVYADTLGEIKKLNEMIANEDISEKISRIELITSSIFEIVETEPEKIHRISTFMNCYLPTTLKLLGKYAQYEKYGAGNNVSDLKTEIEAIVEKLASGFAKQLDALLLDDVLNVSSDIDVLETMLVRDGLSNEGNLSNLNI